MPDKDLEKEILLTAEGLKKLEEKLEYYKTFHRKEVADRIRQAKEFGDISENAEYEDAKMEQAFVEAEIINLERMIRKAKLIDESEIHTDIVSVGSTVKLKHADSNESESYTIVGSAESDPSNHRISNESPVGKALLGKHKGEQVEAKTPAGKIKYKILEISKK
ncbi:MAG: transcription elongation factor GreA [Candidatus Eremiobacteraeota bacterium]|nr:transcription elongation factor GreA [Candidatus Eremiobacteraeota bacterium]